jgi:hypothetical protein
VVALISARVAVSAVLPARAPSQLASDVMPLNSSELAIAATMASRSAWVKVLPPPPPAEPGDKKKKYGMAVIYLYPRFTT